MKALKIAAMSIVGIIVILLLVGLVLPKDFHVERSITINAPKDKVFAHIVDLKEWRNWGIWFERDPNMQVTYTGDDSAVGMKSSWISEQEGSGEMTITAISPGKTMVYNLYFPDFDMGSTGELTVSVQDDSTKVVWTNHGELGGNPVNGFFAMMMDGMIGPDFEAGLSNLKKLTESQ